MGTTLKEIWEEKDMSPAQVAAQANISVQTLYRMNKKNENVSVRLVERVCRVLGITRKQYEQLEAD